MFFLKLIKALKAQLNIDKLSDFGHTWKRGRNQLVSWKEKKPVNSPYGLISQGPLWIAYCRSNERKT